jgi:hypothetical protein
MKQLILPEKVIFKGKKSSIIIRVLISLEKISAAKKEAGI